jgi:hypothetical protein
LLGGGGLESSAVPRPVTLNELIGPLPAEFAWIQIAILRDPDAGGLDPRYLDLVTCLPDPRPRVVSLQTANVSNLTLGDVNLDACLFLGVHKLEGLGLEGDWSLATAPIPGRPRRWGRKALADEHHLRALRHERGWVDIDRITHDDEVGLTRADAAKLAGTYRALRKGREDAKDAPARPIFTMAKWRCGACRPSPHGQIGQFSGCTGLFQATGCAQAALWRGSRSWSSPAMPTTAKPITSSSNAAVAVTCAFWLWGLQPSPGWSLAGWVSAVTIHAILRRFSERLALGYVVVRTMEGVVDLIAAISALMLLSVSRNLVSAGSSAATLQTLGGVLLSENNWVSYVIMPLVFALDALILN